MATPGVGENRPADPAAYADEYGRGDGWILFAGSMMLMLGTMNLIQGIAAVSNSSFYVANARYIISDLNTLGWVLDRARCRPAPGRVRDLGAYEGRALVRHHGRRPQRDRATAVHLVLSVLVAHAVHARHPRDLRAGGVRRQAPRLNATSAPCSHLRRRAIASTWPSGSAAHRRAVDRAAALRLSSTRGRSLAPSPPPADCLAQRVGSARAPR